MRATETDHEGWERVERAVHEERALDGLYLGPFLIESEVGRGGMGRVYRARDARLDRRVALKLLNFDRADDAVRRARFLREARLAASLQHPNVCTVHELGNHGDLLYLVLELLDGQTLRDRLRRGALPATAAVDVAKQVAAALDAAHRRDLIHRDLKPENIMLTPEGVKVLDFGLARSIAGPLVDTPGSVSLTAEGTVLGTPECMSPEQAQGTALDARSDVFAFGTVLYECLTGRSPFARDNPMRTMAAVVAEDPPAVASSATDAPAPVVDLVDACLRKRADQRPADGGDLLRRLEATAPSADVSNRQLATETMELPPAADIPARRWSTLWIGAALVVVGVALALAASDGDDGDDRVLATPVLSDDPQAQAAIRRWFAVWEASGDHFGPPELFISSEARELPVIRALGAVIGHSEPSALDEAREAVGDEEGPGPELVRLLSDGTTTRTETLFWAQSFRPPNGEASPEAYLERYARYRVLGTAALHVVRVPDRHVRLRPLYATAPSALRARWLGLSLRAHGDRDGAERTLTEAMARFPFAAGALREERSWIALGRGQISRFREEIETMATEGRGLRHRVELLMEQGEHDRALDLLEGLAPASISRKRNVLQDVIVFSCAQGITGAALERSLANVDRLIDANRPLVAADALWSMGPCVFGLGIDGAPILERLRRVARRPDLPAPTLRLLVARAELFAGAVGRAEVADPAAALERAAASGFVLAPASAGLAGALTAHAAGDRDDALKRTRATLAALTDEQRRLDPVAPAALAAFAALWSSDDATIEGRQALERVLLDKKACLEVRRTERQGCRPFVLRALVRDAELSLAAGERERAARDVAEVRAFFPHATDGSPLMRRLASVDRKLRSLQR